MKKQLLTARLKQGRKCTKSVLSLFVFFCISLLAKAQEDDIKIRCLDNGSVAIYGVFYGELIFPNGDTLGNFNVGTEINNGFFLALLDSSGNISWTKHLACETTHWGGFATGIDITSDENSNIYICGDYSDSLYIGDTDTLVSFWYTNAFLSKFDTLGNMLWTAEPEIIDSSTYSRASSLDYHNGKIYMGGMYTNGSFTFNGLTPLVDNSYNANLFFAQFDTAGIGLWQRSGHGGTQSMSSNHTTYDLKVNDLGEFYATGVFGGNSTNGTLYYDALSVTLIPGYSGYYRTFILKGDSLGNGIWMRKNEGLGEPVYPEELTISDLDKIYLTGWYRNEYNYDGIQGGTTDNRDLHITKIDSTGSAYWALSASETPDFDSNYPTGIAADTAGYLYEIGFFENPIHFPPLSPLSSSGSGNNGFISKLTPGGSGICQVASNEPFEDLSIDQDNYLYTISGDKGEQFAPYIEILVKKWENCQLIWEMNVLHSWEELPWSVEEQNLNKLTIYPNPNHGLFSVDIEDKGILQIFNVKGELVYEEKVFKGIQEFSLDNSAPGLYVIQLTSDKKVSHGKIQLY